MVKTTRKVELSNLEMLKSNTKIGIIDESEGKEVLLESIAGRELK